MKLREIQQQNERLRQLMLSLAHPSAWEKTEALSEQSIAILAQDRRISQINAVYLVGHGTSYATALNGEAYMAHLAKAYAKAVPAFQFAQYMEDYLLKPIETLVIGISCGGNTASVENCLKKAASSGAMTVCVSGEKRGCCACAAGYHVVTDAHIEQQINASAYSVSHLFLLLGLYKLSIAIGVATGRMNKTEKEAWEEKFEKTKESLICLPELFQQMGDICAKLESLHSVAAVAVLGTGPNIGTMKEGALKISEFCWKFCAGEELEDFAHGRFREVDASIPMFILSHGDKTRAKTKDLLAGCYKSQTPVVVITADEDEAINKLSTFVVKMPALTDEYLSPFVYVFPLWFYGFHCNATKGLLVGEKRYELYAADVDFSAYFNAQGSRISSFVFDTSQPLMEE